jgi:hypothetical protein
MKAWSCRIVDQDPIIIPDLLRQGMQCGQYRLGPFGSAGAGLDSAIAAGLGIRPPMIGRMQWHHAAGKRGGIHQSGKGDIENETLADSKVLFRLFGLHTLADAGGRDNQPKSRSRHRQSVFNNQEKGLVVSNQAEVHSGPLFNGALLITQIPDFGIQTFIAGSQFGIFFTLLGDGLLESPYLRKAALPDPQAHLQQENNNNHCGPEQLHCRFQSNSINQNANAGR